MIELGKRTHSRKNLSLKEVKGLITLQPRGEHVSFQVCDLNELNMGIAIKAPINVETEVNISISRPFSLALLGTIRWCKKKDEGVYRCGLEIHDNSRRFFIFQQQFSDLLKKL